MPVGVERERVLHQPVPDQITVGLAPRIKAGVKGGRNEAALHDADIARQIGIERALQHRAGMQSRRIEGGDLAQRMHACIRPARALQADFPAPDFFQGGFDALLHGPLVGLPLPLPA